MGQLYSSNVFACANANVCESFTQVLFSFVGMSTFVTVTLKCCFRLWKCRRLGQSHSRVVFVCGHADDCESCTQVLYFFCGHVDVCDSYTQVLFSFVGMPAFGIVTFKCCFSLWECRRL